MAGVTAIQGVDDTLKQARDGRGRGAVAASRRSRSGRSTATATSCG